MTGAHLFQNEYSRGAGSHSYLSAEPVEPVLFGPVELAIAAKHPARVEALPQSDLKTWIMREVTFASVFLAYATPFIIWAIQTH